ncbi:MAG TPA: glycosyltransferase family 4 protein [Xanthomonadales bacterium]|nr:glycosyltransferase family 4 protein [Xanthomonadales bacterium]
MRIFYLINGFNGGGAAFPIPELVGLMRTGGHEVKVYGLMMQDGKACATLEKAGISHEILGQGKWNFLGSCWRLIRSLRRESPDLIWTSLTRATLFGQLAGKTLGIPVVSWQHNAFLKRSNLFLLRMTKRLSWQWVTDSANVREFAINELGVPPDKISIWPMFHTLPGSPISRPWPGAGPIRIGSLGRVHANKRYEVLIQVAARMQNDYPELSSCIEFVVGGDGPELQSLESLLEELNLKNVHFVGYVEDTANFLANLHIYIQPSHHEGLCIAAHEAMQAALPVIATRVGQLQYSIIDGETGLLCDVDDVNGLLQAVLSLIRDPARARAMGIAARQRVTTLFSPEVFRQSGEQLLRKLEQGLSLREH